MKFREKDKITLFIYETKNLMYPRSRGVIPITFKGFGYVGMLGNFFILHKVTESGIHIAPCLGLQLPEFHFCYIFVYLAVVFRLPAKPPLGQYCPLTVL